MKRPCSPRLLIYFVAFLGAISLTRSVLAEGDHEGISEHEEEMEMHHHTPSSNDDPGLPPGTKEVKIELSGAFCHRHPDEITEGLMKLGGVIHVEAFSGRKYILVHYDGGKALSAEDMAAAVTGLKGSGWRCKGTVSTLRQTER